MTAVMCYTSCLSTLKIAYRSQLCSQIQMSLGISTGLFKKKNSKDNLRFITKGTLQKIQKLNIVQVGG